MKSQIYQISWEKYQKDPTVIDQVLDKYKDNLKGKVAIKTHFGEPGNKNALRGSIIKPVIDWVVKNKIKGFLTDTNTLYTGFRNEVKNHLETAKKHGFSDLGVPVEIADEEYPEFKLSKLPNQYAKLPIRLGRKLVEADSLLCISHFKGHRMFGFGGALKNLGMGGATPKGKRILHSGFAGNIDRSLCKLCKVCQNNCPVKAIYLEKDQIQINYSKCIGCGECVSVCPKGAIEASDRDTKISEEKTAVYAYALIKEKSGIYINFLININKLCDCASSTEPKLLPDLGIMISDDPLALDKASIDWVNLASGKDLFLEVENSEYTHILKTAEELKIGSLKYKIEEL